MNQNNIIYFENIDNFSTTVASALCAGEAFAAITPSFTASVIQGSVSGTLSLITENSTSTSQLIAGRIVVEANSLSTFTLSFVPSETAYGFEAGSHYDISINPGFRITNSNSNNEREEWRKHYTVIDINGEDKNFLQKNKKDK